MARSKKSKKTGKILAAEQLEIGLAVDATEYCDVTREHNPDDRWSGEDTSSSWQVEGVYLTNKDTTYPDVTACFPVKAGDTVYVVYAIYSTGDSFGHRENGGMAFIDVFKTFDKAEEAAKAIREHSDWYKRIHSRWEPLPAKERKKLAKRYKGEFTVEIVRENGKKLDIHASWNGYFESLSYVEVKSLTVDANKRGRY